MNKTDSLMLGIQKPNKIDSLWRSKYPTDPVYQWCEKHVIEIVKTIYFFKIFYQAKNQWQPRWQGERPGNCCLPKLVGATHLAFLGLVKQNLIADKIANLWFSVTYCAWRQCLDDANKPGPSTNMPLPLPKLYQIGYGH